MPKKSITNEQKKRKKKNRELVRMTRFELTGKGKRFRYVDWWNIYKKNYMKSDQNQILE